MDEALCWVHAGPWRDAFDENFLENTLHIIPANLSLLPCNMPAATVPLCLLVP
jgi:hypothetical protein